MTEGRWVCLRGCVQAVGSETWDWLRGGKAIQSISERSLEPHINGYPEVSQGRIPNLEIIKKCWNSLYLLDGKQNI